MATTDISKVFKTKIDVTLTKDDFVAVAIADYEKRLTQARTSDEETLEDLNKKVENLQKQISKACSDAADKAATIKLKPIVKAAAQLAGAEFSEDDLAVSAEEYLPNTKEEYKPADHYIVYKATFVFKSVVPKKAKADFGLSFESFGRVEIPAAILDLINVLAGVQDQLEEVSQHLFKVRRALQDMSKYERQARSEVARKAMSAAEDGREINLSDIFNIEGFGDVKLLPAGK